MSTAHGAMSAEEEQILAIGVTDSPAVAKRALEMAPLAEGRTAIPHRNLRPLWGFSVQTRMGCGRMTERPSPGGE